MLHELEKTDELLESDEILISGCPLYIAFAEFFANSTSTTIFHNLRVIVVTVDKREEHTIIKVRPVELDDPQLKPPPHRLNIKEISFIKETCRIILLHRDNLNI